MSDLNLIITKIVSFLNINFIVFGHTLTLAGVLVSLSLMSVVFYAIYRLYR